MSHVVQFHPHALKAPKTPADFPAKPKSAWLPVSVTPEVSALLESNAVVAIGVSGGKDSDACAIAVSEYLDKIGHTGPRVLVHADLGVVEWKDSLPSCERLAKKLGWELLTVRRKAGDMMDRWEGRWANNMARYADLSVVKTILPWSTPSMRFCTSELKNDVIASNLKKRFPEHNILNVTGIRREESTNREKMPVSSPNAKLKRRGLIGFNWNAIIEWDIGQVFSVIQDRGLQLHEAYVKYHASRVSCVCCIMSAAADLVAATSAPENHDVYRRMVELEARSTFAFQGGKWLADVAPHLLSDDLKERVTEAKVKAKRREELEALIPKHLLYVKNKPVAMPTPEEAELIARVRQDIGALLNVPVSCTTGDDVMARYAELIVTKVTVEEVEEETAALFEEPMSCGAGEIGFETEEEDESDDEEMASAPSM